MQDGKPRPKRFLRWNGYDAADVALMNVFIMAEEVGGGIFRGHHKYANQLYDIADKISKQKYQPALEKLTQLRQQINTDSAPQWISMLAVGYGLG